MCMVRTDVLPMHLGALERTQQIHTGPSNLPAPRRPFAARAQALQMEELDSFLHGTPPNATSSAKCSSLLMWPTHPNDSTPQMKEFRPSEELRQMRQAPSDAARSL